MRLGGVCLLAQIFVLCLHGDEASRTSRAKVDRWVLELALPSKQNCKEAESPHLLGNRSNLMDPKCECGTSESPSPAQRLPCVLSSSLMPHDLSPGLDLGPSPGRLAAASFLSWVLAVFHLTSVENS